MRGTRCQMAAFPGAPVSQGVRRRMLSHTQLSSAMQRAITLAHRGPAGDVNPQVGCVILDEHGTIICEGIHAGAGTEHAEIVALTNHNPCLDPATLTSV